MYSNIIYKKTGIEIKVEKIKHKTFDLVMGK